MYVYKYNCILLSGMWQKVHREDTERKKEAACLEDAMPSGSSWGGGGGIA